MLIDRILYPIHALGPGKRLCIWTVGCTKRCLYCSNSELWRADKSKDIPLKDLISIIQNVSSRHQIDGITITGGDPLEQKDELLKLLPSLKVITNDILVYTGFTYRQLKEQLPCEELDLLCSMMGVLIDGKYEHELNCEDCALRGSSNQNIYYFDEGLKPKYEAYMKQQGRIIQNVFSGERVVSVGIHNKEG